MQDQDRIEEIRKRVEAATPGPWKVRPDEFDDWGTIRGPDIAVEGRKWPRKWLVAIARSGEQPSEENENRHRRDGTDPYEHNASFIAHARADLPWALDRLAEKDAEIARLKLTISGKTFSCEACDSAAKEIARLTADLEHLRAYAQNLEADNTEVNGFLASADKREAGLRADLTQARADMEAAKRERDRFRDWLWEGLEYAFKAKLYIIGWGAQEKADADAKAQLRAELAAAKAEARQAWDLGHLALAERDAATTDPACPHLEFLGTRVDSAGRRANHHHHPTEKKE